MYNNKPSYVNKVNAFKHNPYKIHPDLLEEKHHKINNANKTHSLGLGLGVEKTRNLTKLARFPNTTLHLGGRWFLSTIDDSEVLFHYSRHATANLTAQQSNQLWNVTQKIKSKVLCVESIIFSRVVVKENICTYYLTCIVVF